MWLTEAVAAGTTKMRVKMAAVLLTEEVAGRDRSSLATRRALAAFPTGKTFDGWHQALSSIPAPTQAALHTLEWLSRAENLVVCGPAGTGKTFLLEALGVLVRRHRTADSVINGSP